MKRIYSMLLALGVASASILAQNVTVFMKDNTVHKYNAEYLSKIAVRDATPSPEVVDFKTIDLNVFSYGNVTITLKNETQDVVCVCDLYGPTDASYLNSGTYTVDGSTQPFTIDPAYSNITLEGETAKPASGTVTVAIGQPSNPSIFREASNSHVYTINVDLELVNGKTLVGKFVGELPSYTPWIEDTLSAAKYNINPQPDGQYYVKFNDANWKYEFAIVFMADGNYDALPEGTYTYSEMATPGSLLPGSYVEGYNPNFYSKLLSGSQVTVTKDGDNYHIEMALVLTDGREATFTFDGSISGTPLFVQPDPIEMETVGMDIEIWNTSNVSLNFYNEGNTQMLVLDTYLPSGCSYLPEGVYTIGGSEAPYIDVSNLTYTYFMQNDEEHDGVKTALKSGTLTVTREGEVYTFVLNATLNDDKNTPISMTYSSTLSKFGPVVNITLSAASYSVGQQPKGSFLIKFNDVNYNCEAAIHFWSFPFANMLYGYETPDTYEYVDTETGAPFQFSKDSVVKLYNPYSYNTMVAGSKIVVSGNGADMYNIVMDLIFEDGRTAHLTYEGTISGTPSFQ